MSAVTHRREVMATVQAPPPAPFTAKRTVGFYVYQPVRIDQAIGLVMGFVYDGRVLRAVIVLMLESRETVHVEPGKVEVM